MGLAELAEKIKTAVQSDRRFSLLLVARAEPRNQQEEQDEDDQEDNRPTGVTTEYAVHEA